MRTTSKLFTHDGSVDAQRAGISRIGHRRLKRITRNSVSENAFKKVLRIWENDTITSIRSAALLLW